MLTILRHFAAVLVNQNLAGLDDIAGLVVIEADRSDVRRQPDDTQREYRFRRVGDRIKFIRGLVDTDIRGLRRCLRTRTSRLASSTPTAFATESHLDIDGKGA